ATVSILVLDQAPSLQNQQYAVLALQATQIPVPGLLDGASDPEGDAITVTSVTQPTQGSVQFNANGSFLFTPSTNLNSYSDSFSYQVTDSLGQTTTANVTLLINHPPVA